MPAAWSSAECIELRLNRRNAIGIDFWKAVDGDNEIVHCRFDPADRIENTSMLVGERPVPDGFVMEDAVPEITYFVKSFCQVAACSVVARHVREGVFDDCRPQHLLVTAV